MCVAAELVLTTLDIVIIVGAQLDDDKEDADENMPALLHGLVWNVDNEITAVQDVIPTALCIDDDAEG